MEGGLDLKLTAAFIDNRFMFFSCWNLDLITGVSWAEAQVFHQMVLIMNGEMF